jgi:eukaryotic-like serine/threonine-protein kinase
MDPSQELLGGRYRLRSVLANGGMGRVWLAQDVRLRRSVAVKILRSEFTGDATFLTRFRAEARCAALLNHPHIAAVHDYGEAVALDTGEPLAYLVMELVDGESLFDLLARRGRLHASETLHIIGQTAAALAAAHAAGVVHRDVKPGNVLVTPNLDVKITDFGIAQSASSVPLTGTGRVMGTAQYLSPEQAAGAKATPASDVYALGVVAYECLAGRRPFEGDSPVQVALQHIQDMPPPLPPTVPDDVRRLVEQAMAKDPAARFLDGAALRDAIDRLAAPGSPVAAHRQPTALLAAQSSARIAVATSPAPTAPAPTPPTPTASVTTAAAPTAAAPTAAAPTAAAPTAETRHLPASSIDRRGRDNRRFAVLLESAALALLVVIAVVAALNRTGGGTGAASHTPVQVRATDLVGRPLAGVEAQLTTLGLKVQPRPIAAGDLPAGQVIAVDPVGRVVPGQTVVITYAVAPPVAATQGKSDGHGNGAGDGEGD